MDSLENIARQLQSREEEVRRDAVHKLGSTSQDGALTLLYQALGDSSWRVRKSAVQTLIKFQDTRKAVNTLIDALYDQDNVGRRTGGVEGLISLNQKALAGVIEAMNTSDPEVRKFLVDILGEMKDPGSLDTLLAAVNDPEENIRLAAIEALGNMGGQMVYEKLVRLLHHTDISIIFGSLHALGRMGSEIPLPVIEKLMERKILRRALFEVLGQSKNQEAVKILASGLADASRSARQAALKSLYKIYKRNQEDAGSNNAVEQEIKKNMAGKPLDGVGEFLQSDHVELKRSAAWIFGILANAGAINYLFDALDDDTILGELFKALATIRREHEDWFTEELKRHDEDIQKRVTGLFQDMAPQVPVRKGVPLPVEMTADQFEWLRDSIAEYGGLYFDKEMKYVVERRITHRLKESGCKDFAEYIQYISNPKVKMIELDRITGELATKETYFFREEFQLRALREEILPAVMKDKEKQGQDTIRLWSAGCASGEEPYTMAMIIKEMKLAPRWKVEIYASDIAEKSLQAAQAGIYGASAFRVMDDYYLNRYFTKLDGTYQISRGIQSMVRFDKLNLLQCRTVPYLQSMDIILCRNVIIYFHPDKKRNLVEDFFRILGEGGYLLLGHSESLMNLSTDFQLKHLKNDMVYQKPMKDPG